MHEEGNDNEVYCEFCGTCGEPGCCSLENFIKYHVKGKTSCLYEGIYIAEILDMIEELNSK